jgi:hypothetical protein
VTGPADPPPQRSPVGAGGGPNAAGAATVDSGVGRPRSILEEERDFFLRSLRDLEAEHDAGDIDDIDYAALHDDYTVRAADVLRRLADLDRAPAPAAPARPVVDAPSVTPPATGSADAGDADAGDADAGDADAGDADAGDADAGDADAGTRPGPWWRGRFGFALAAAAVCAVVVAGVVLLHRGGGETTTQRVDALDVAAQTALAGHVPDLGRGLADYGAALRLDPDNPVALTGEGEILTDAGEAAHGTSAELSLGLSQLRRAEAVDAAYGPAYGVMGIALYVEHDYRQAVAQLTTYTAETPREAQNVTALRALADARAKLAAAGST